MRLLLLLILAGGLTATGMLSYQRLFHTPLPGCGAGSACEEAAASRFAAIYGYPVAYLGFGFAFATFLAWLENPRRPISWPFLWVIRAGALTSIVFLVLIVEHGHYCHYCLIAHGCNLAAWLLVEWLPRSRRWALPGLVLALGFGAVIGFQAATELYQDATYHRDKDQVTQQIIADLVRTWTEHAQVWLPVAATGGHRAGPAAAPIHITVFFDYTCSYCRGLDGTVSELLKRGDVNVTWRLFPRPGNSNAANDRHADSMRRARLAAAAARVGGEAAFAQMHKWLFAHRDSIRDEELEEALPSLGISDGDAFWAAVHSPVVRDEIGEDAKLGKQLGVDRTPAVFVNGVRLVTWDPVQATKIAVTTIAAALCKHE